MRSRRLLFLVGMLLVAGLSACEPGMGLPPTALPTTPLSFPPTNTPIPPLDTAVHTPTASSTFTPSPTLTPTSLPSPTPTSTPVPLPGMGVETHRAGADNVRLMHQAGVAIVRRNAYLWSYVEPQEGQRRWGAMNSLENELKRLSENGIEVILIVRSTPTWAQKIPGYYCGAVKADKLAAFAAFMFDLVSRLSSPPYNVKYWELGNEPDVDPSLVNQDDPFGCWGDIQDEYYGGGYYAEMLKAVYPSIKQANPDAQVLIGGLLLNCDPTYPPPGDDCKPARFLEGILSNGGGSYFDFVSFHGYPVYNGTLERDKNFPGWEQRGGVVMGKIDFLREVMNSFGVDKPIIHSEGSLICPEWNSRYCKPPGDDFYEAQADYVVILFIRNWGMGITSTIWYQFESPAWRYSSLLGTRYVNNLAYRAFEFLNQELQEASLVKELIQYPQITGYEFTSPGKRIWVLWSVDNEAHPLNLPDETTQVYDKYGDQISLEDDVLQVKSPIYLELTP